MSETKRVVVPPTVYDQAKKLKDNRGFATLGEAIRHMCQEGNYDV